jgi:hypothetical protein
MKKTKVVKIESDVVIDVICDLCGESTKTLNSVEPFSYGTLSFDGGFGSEHDGERVQLDLCEACVFTIVRLRKSGVYISIDGDVLTEDMLHNI